MSFIVNSKKIQKEEYPVIQSNLQLYATGNTGTSGLCPYSSKSVTATTKN